MTSLAPAWPGRTRREAWESSPPPCRSERPRFRDDEALTRYNVVRDRNIWSGMAVVLGTRIPVFLIDDLYSETDDISEVLAAFPRLTEGSIFYALAYARDHAVLVAQDRDRHHRAIEAAIR